MDAPTPAPSPTMEPEGAAYELFWQCLEADELAASDQAEENAEGDAYVRFWELSDV